MAPFSFCRVCRINHDKGKGHKYGVKHKRYLAEFLSKARKKIQDIRVLLKETTRLQDEDRGRTKFWCAFCEQDIGEQASAFARESAIRHLGGSPHLTSVKKFVFEQGADVADTHHLFISEDEISKWQERCRVLTSTMASTSGVELFRTNNIHSGISRNDRGSSSLTLGNRQTVSHVDASIHAGVEPLSVLTLGSSQKPVPSDSVATANGDQCWFSMSGATVAGSGLHYMDSASRMTPVAFDIGASTSMSSHDYLPETAKGISDRSGGANRAHGIQAPGGYGLATNGTASAQYIMPHLPGAAPSQYTVMAAGQDLAKIVCPPLLPGEGNVHSGATPPWIGPGDDKKLFGASSVEIGPSMETPKKQPLSRTQERKLAKLRPPNRVGAAWAEIRRAQFERAERGEAFEGVPEADATWLPNFGRVWQSGSRHDTRKEFEAEKRKEAKRLGRPLRKRGASSLGIPVQFQPYVGKRQKSGEDR